MSSRKQQLLSRHRRRKRLLLALSALALAVLGFGVGWGLPALLLLFGWVAHEAWFADHLFYSPQDDYQYRFPADAARQEVALDDGRLRLSAPLPAAETLIVELDLRSTWLGRWLDPQVLFADDRQDFERAVRGRRFLNLSGQAEALGRG